MLALMCYFRIFVPRLEFLFRVNSTYAMCNCVLSEECTNELTLHLCWFSSVKILTKGASSTVCL